MLHIYLNILSWGEHLPATSLYLFIFAWLFIESTGFPISDELLLVPVGTLVASGRLNLALVLGIALLGKVSASCLAYWLGHYIKLERLARPEVQPAGGWQRWLYYVRPTAAFVLATEERFRRQGAWGVFLGRLIPVVRSFISYPAGAAHMPFPIFLAATASGSLLWITTWTVLGMVLGKSAEQLSGPVSLLVIGAVVVALVVVWVWNHRRTEAAALRLQAQRLAEAARQARHAPHRRADAAPPAAGRPHRPKARAAQAKGDGGSHRV